MFHEAHLSHLLALLKGMVHVSHFKVCQIHGDLGQSLLLQEPANCLAVLQWTML